MGRKGWRGLKDIQIMSKNGKIKVRWQWDSQDIQHVSIFYKKKGDIHNPGIKLNKHKIYKIPNKDIGEEEKELTLERGLYTFIFFINEGEEGSREIVRDDIMLGEPFRVDMEWQGHKAGTVVSFRLSESELPADTLRYEAEGYKHLLPYPVRTGCRLLVPNVFDREKIHFRIVEPYNKAYVLV